MTPLGNPNEKFRKKIPKSSQYFYYYFPDFAPILNFTGNCMCMEQERRQNKIFQDSKFFSKYLIALKHSYFPFIYSSCFKNVD